MPDSQSRKSVFKSPLLLLQSLGILFSPHQPSFLSCINECLGVDNGGNVSDSLRAIISPWLNGFQRRSGVGAGMNKSARGEL